MQYENLRLHDRYYFDKLTAMTIHQLVFASALTLFAASSASAQLAVCAPKVGSQNLCEAARELAGLVSEQLPTTHERVTLETAVALNNVVKVSGKLDFDPQSARRYLAEQSLTVRQFEDRYSAQMAPQLCTAGSQTQAFIKAGGAILYAYSYKDGKPFIRFGVRGC